MFLQDLYDDFKRSVNNGRSYISENLNTSYKYPWPTFIGVVGWIVTLILAPILATDRNEYSSQRSRDQDYYWVVFAFTMAAGFTTVFDYNKNEKNAWTMVTVFFGSMATFLSFSLWAVDKNKKMSTALIFVQTAANSVQLSAIFNNNRKPVPLDFNRDPVRQQTIYKIGVSSST